MHKPRVGVFTFQKLDNEKNLYCPKNIKSETLNKYFSKPLSTSPNGQKHQSFYLFILFKKKAKNYCEVTW